MGRKLCPHCDPYPVDAAHLPEKLENLLSPLSAFFNALEGLLRKFLPRFHAALFSAVMVGVFKMLLVIVVLKEAEAEDSDKNLYNRALVVVQEGRRRGIPVKSIKFLGRGTDYFSIEARGVKKIFEGLPHLVIGHTDLVNFDDKAELKELLQKAGLPHPQGGVFRNSTAALRYVRETIKFPVVVKPRRGSLSRHTFTDLQNESRLIAAIRAAKVMGREFIVEKFVKGLVYRITLVNGGVAASCLREPPNVVGDGKHTVRELVAIKNNDPLRGEIRQKNFTLHKIAISPKTDALLASQNLNMESVPQSGQKVYLNDKIVLACGADIHDTTDKICPENRALFEEVYKLCGAPLIGIDFIAEDISKPHDKQKCAIIEVNSLPYIDMHHYPVTGEKRNVASRILDYYLNAL